MHDGLSMSVESAILRHAGQATSVRQAFEGLEQHEQGAAAGVSRLPLTSQGMKPGQGDGPRDALGVVPRSPSTTDIIFGWMSELAQKVWAKTLLWTGRNAIIGGIEHPSDDHPYSAWVDVRGWAIGLDARSALTVELLVGDTLAHRVTPNAPRPDVGARFPGVPGADRCGFETRLTTAVLPWQGATVLTVRAVSESPHKGHAILGTRRIRWQDTIASRVNYGGVWDDSGVSGSIVNARISVAGNADPEEYSRSGEATAGDIVEHASVTANDTVLEIGCGTGRIGIKLAPRCGHWIGSDVSRNMLQHAQDTLRESRNVSFVHLNGTDLYGIADQSVDVAYCSGVFMHLDQWDRYRYVWKPAAC